MIDQCSVPSRSEVLQQGRRKKANRSRNSEKPSFISFGRISVHNIVKASIAKDGGNRPKTHKIQRSQQYQARMTNMKEEMDKFGEIQNLPLIMKMTADTYFQWLDVGEFQGISFKNVQKVKL